MQFPTFSPEVVSHTLLPHFTLTSVFLILLSFPQPLIKTNILKTNKTNIVFFIISPF